MLVSLLVAAILVGLIIYVLSLLPLAEPFKSIAYVIVVVILIIWLLQGLPHTGRLY